MILGFNLGSGLVEKRVSKVSMRARKDVSIFRVGCCVSA